MAKGVEKGCMKKDIRLQALWIERVLLGVSGVKWYLGRRRYWGWGPEGSDLQNT